MKRALIRVDGSLKIGLGHIMRCLGLAQGLEKAGIDSIFVLKNLEPSITGLIQRCGFGAQLIPADSTLEQDKDLMLQFIEQYHAGIVITDIYNEDVLANTDRYLGYLKSLKQYVPCLITIDDLSVMDFPSDILINPNYGAETLNYHRGNHTRYLLGPAYFIFRQEFIDAAKVQRTIKKDARNILVTMGGSDLLNLTLKVLMALSKLSNIADLFLRIIPGVDFSPDRMKLLKDAIRSFNGTCEFCSTESNIAASMLWADLAIIGGGLTKYEAAITGTPAIIISQIKHQEKFSSLFIREGSALLLGYGDKIKEEEIVKATDRLLRDHALRTEMSAKGKKLVDEKGIERIIEEILKVL